MATTSTKKPARAKSKTKTPTRIIRPAATVNPCDDQNGLLTCWGGHPTNKPFPTSGGPWAVVVAYNAQTGLMELQYADLGTLCPGSASLVATPCRPCGEAPSEEPITEQPNS